MNYIAKNDRYNSMIYNTSGNSGLKLPAISLGLWHNFGSVDNYENIKDMALTAFDLGITYFDIANNYGPIPGSAEENFGKLLKNELKPYRNELVISTKAGYLMWDGPYGDGGSRKYLLSSLDDSLKRLGLDYVDIFYSHRRDTQTPLEETMGALVSTVKSGKAIYVGLSNYSPEDTKKASNILAENGIHCLIHQPRYNMLDRRVEIDGLFKTLEKEGIGSVAFCPLAQGMLTTKYIGGIPKDSRAQKSTGFLKPAQITEEKIEIIKKLNSFAQNRGQSLPQMALAWALCVGNLTSVLIGASRAEQIEENVKALSNLTFTKEELANIDIILK